MEITFKFEPNASAQEIAAQLRFRANLFDGMPAKEAAKVENTTASSAVDCTKEDAQAMVSDESKTEAAPVEKYKRKSKLKTAEAFELPTTEPESETDESQNDDDAEETTTPPLAVEEKTFVLNEVIDAFRDFAKSQPKYPKGRREEAAAILKKFGVTSVHHLKPEQFGKVLSLIGA